VTEKNAIDQKKIADALAFVLREERGMTPFAHALSTTTTTTSSSSSSSSSSPSSSSNARYWCIQLINENATNKKSYHVTLAYFGNKGPTTAAQKSVDQKLLAMEGQVVEMGIGEFYQDERVAACHVMLPAGVPCENEHPHITLWTAPGVAPMESNRMLASTEKIRRTTIGEDHYLEVGAVVKGKIMRVR
jgi:hypothetical protein